MHDVTRYNINITCMLDSGATNNFISLEIVNRLGLDIGNSPVVKFVRLANGVQVKVSGIVSAMV